MHKFKDKHMHVLYLHREVTALLVEGNREVTALLVEGNTLQVLPVESECR